MGRSAPKPGRCSIRRTDPSHSAVSPARSAFKHRTYSATRRHGIGRVPSANRPVNPEPTATATRPGAWRTNSAIAAALTIGWRRLGTRTPGPRPMPRCAFRAPAEHHPHVGVDRWRVIQPRPLVAERFGQLRLHGSVGRGCERARYLHDPTITIGRLVIPRAGNSRSQSSESFIEGGVEVSDRAFVAAELHE